MGIHAVADLKLAVKRAGKWIYAWCEGCGYAKEYMERVCARGAPLDVKGWKCEKCALFRGDETFKPCPGCGTMTEKASGYVLESVLERGDC
jgi:hypothetical protein